MCVDDTLQKFLTTPQLPFSSHFHLPSLRFFYFNHWQKKWSQTKYFFFLCLFPAFQLLSIQFIVKKMVKYSSAVFKRIGLEIAWQYHNRETSTSEEIRTFRGLFGVSWNLCETVWALLDENGKYSEYRMPKHLIWTLLFLKTYGNERVHAALVKATPKTFRKWSWRTIEELAELSTFVVSKKSITLLYFINSIALLSYV